MALLALDDTDTRTGGCTTHTAHRLAVALDAAEGPLAPWGLTAPPRLVRLCPAIREKTRGNGALVLPVGRVDPEAHAILIGRRPDGTPLFARPEHDPAPVTADEHEALQRLVETCLPVPAPDDQDPQPAALLLPDAPDPALYTHAVARRVTPDEAWAAAPPGTLPLTPPGRRGEIGALAAAAWHPHPHGMTWEAIGYRTPHHPRSLPPNFPATLEHLTGGFDNLDPATGRIRAVPRTPCPVRFGVRGLDPQALLGLAAPLWCLDGTGGWLVATNHARGDHLRHACTTLAAERVVRLDVTVAAAPRRIRGGHVFLAATHQGQTVRLAAYEPTKGLRAAVAALVPGDQVTVEGRTREDPTVVALERLGIRHLAPRLVPGPNPRCDACDRSMKSRGRDAGFRCPACHATLPATSRVLTPQAPGVQAGVRYQVPDHVRGHLLPPAAELPPAAPLALQRSARAVART